MKKNQNKSAFTLVELIVVITILAILGTIAFISLQGYSESARDSKRISDIQNIKKSLELFSINTGKYPLPDNIETVSFSGDILWKQGIIGDNVTKNLSRNLQEKPLDPLFDLEYIYSVTNSQKEYELLALYESDLVYNNILKSTFAAGNFVAKVEGTYNQIYTVSSNYIIPIPSILNAQAVNSSIELDDKSIQSQIISNGENLATSSNSNVTTKTGQLNIKLNSAPIITKDSSNDDKIKVLNAIKNTYSGSTIANMSIYLNIINIDVNEIIQVDNFVNQVILAKTSTVNSTNTNLNVNPVVFNFSFTDLENQDFNSYIESEELTVNGSFSISISGGEYNINGGEWTSNSGNVSNGDIVKVRHLSSGSDNTTTDTILTIGSVSDTFTSTTMTLVCNQGENKVSGVCKDPYWSNVVSLMKFTGDNGSSNITDITGKTVVVDGVIISTEQSKFGNGSAYFNNNSHVRIDSVSDVLGTGDYTFESWVMFSVGSTSGRETLYDFSLGKVLLRSNNGVYENFSGVSINPVSVWHHIAYVRNNGIISLYVDGILKGSFNNTTYLTSGPLIVGKYYNNLIAIFNGYMNEFRFTKGVARYTSDFTPPVLPFANQ